MVKTIPVVRSIEPFFNSSSSSISSPAVTRTDGRSIMHVVVSRCGWKEASQEWTAVYDNFEKIM
jgi:hypothetical protein